MTGPLANLPRLTGTRSARASSWDRTGGNDDRTHIASGASAVLAELDEPGVIRHVWMTIACGDTDYLRKIVLRMFWDRADTPCVEVPVGDFFGIGHARTHNFTSLPLQMSPEDGNAFNCWFPMPFDTAQIEVANETAEQVIVYYYIDYELMGVLTGELTGEPTGGRAAGHDDRLGRFHAQWRRQNPCDGISDQGMPNKEFQFGGTNPDGEGNYVILEAAGEGHYVGCNLNIHNLRDVDITAFNWYGEGDDMIFVDGESFPPALHGTGTEDYFNTAWCPSQEYNAPYHGLTLPGGQNWSGKISMYRFHIEDPVRFRESIKVTIEHGHANRRSDDYSSTAYWYQAEPHAAFPPLPAVGDRLPRPDAPTP